MVFATFSINIIALTLMLFYIQLIGWNVWTISLILIFVNNILLTISILFIANKSVNIFKDIIVKFLECYIKMVYIYPVYFFKQVFTIISNMLNIFYNRINNLMYEYVEMEPLKFLFKEYNHETKAIILTFENNKLLDHKNLFIALFTGLMLHPEFTNRGKKIMIVSICNDDRTFHIHKNIIVDENTTVYNYLEKIKHNIQNFYESGYPLHMFNILQVKLWEYPTASFKSGTKNKNSIHQLRRGFHSSCVMNKTDGLNAIKPLKTPQAISRKLIATMDIETVEFNGIQYPICLTFSYYLKNQLITIIEVIDSNLFENDPDSALKFLWINFMDKLNNLKLKNCVIFTHNLGSFDGYFIYKGLLELPDININNVTSIIDDLHKFISIQVCWKGSKFIFKDSLRVFPVSLQELCSLFGVEGKLHGYNSLYNNLSFFENTNLFKQFIEYSKQDSICLLNALIKAQNIYIEEYDVDIATIVSTATLSLKIFRQNFLKTDIPILTNKLDNIIRLGYLGGSTDYYFKYGENLKHYDVNSLYPKAMLNPMPLEFLGEFEGGGVSLKDVFGFVEARITSPDDLEFPLLSHKVDNETIHPIGSWIGVYFSEELKCVEKFGYKVELIKVYKFSQEYIFNSYIKHFYNIKKLASGALRFIAKMHLNQLYGYFGRKKTLIETKNVLKQDLNKFYGKYTIFSEIDVNKNISTILMSSNLDFSLVNEIKEETQLELKSNFRLVKSHVGIAAAVTAYARIEMIELKMLLVKFGMKLFYTDTDSIFVDNVLPDYLIGKELGLLKDELNGGIIKKAYFLGIKKYGYIDQNDKVHSIFSGVQRNTVTWDEIVKIANGFTVIKNSKVRFFKNFNDLNILIKNDLKITIEFKSKKILINNWYQPIKINIKILVKIHYYLKIIFNRIVKKLKKINTNNIL
jgi:DNA polymerase family B